MNSRVMLVLAVLLIIGAGIAGYLGYQTTAEAQREAQRAAQALIAAEAKTVVVPGKVPVVVALRDIPAFQAITAEDVVLDFVTREPPFTYRDASTLVGQKPQLPIKAGMLITQDHFLSGSEVARLLQPGERAVAIAIDEVVGGGGFVKPGDIVDVLLYAPGENRASGSAQVVMEALRVVGFGVQLIGPEGEAMTAETQQGQRAERQRARTAVLAVNEKDVTRLMLASSVGTLRLSIRPLSDVEQIAAETAPVPLTPKQQAEARRLLLSGQILPATVNPPTAPAPRPPGATAPRAPGSNVVIYRGLEKASNP